MPCMVGGCPTLVPEGKVACTFHWSLVSRDLKLKIWGFCEDRVDRASLDWRLAISVAATVAATSDLRKKAVPVG